MKPVIHASGFTALRSALKELEDKKLFAAELRAVNHAATDHVMSVAQGKASGPADVKAFSEGAIKAIRSQVQGAIRIDNTVWPAAMGREFGSKRWHQFRPWRGNGSSAGYMVMPAVRESSAELASMYAAELDRIITRAFSATSAVEEVL